MIQREKIQIAIIEDRQEERDFLEFVFKKSEDFVISKVYKNAEEAIIFLPQSDVDIAIVDIGLPGEDGIVLVEKMKQILQEVKFMMYTVFDRDDKIFKSLKAGANGYLLKTSDPNKILNAVQDLAQGGSVMSPEIARKVTNFFYNPPEPEFENYELLSSRQKEVLRLLSQGFTNREIGDKLGIVEGTVKLHIHKIYRKLHVKSRLAAAGLYKGQKRKIFR